MVTSRGFFRFVFSAESTGAILKMSACSHRTATDIRHFFFFFFFWSTVRSNSLRLSVLLRTELVYLKSGDPLPRRPIIFPGAVRRRGHGVVVVIGWPRKYSSWLVWRSLNEENSRRHTPFLNGKPRYRGEKIHCWSREKEAKIAECARKKAGSCDFWLLEVFSAKAPNTETDGRLVPSHSCETIARLWNHRTAMKPSHGYETLARLWNPRTTMKPSHGYETLARLWNPRTAMKPSHGYETIARLWNHRTAVKRYAPKKMTNLKWNCS